MKFDFDEALARCNETKKDNEEICYSFGVGRMVPLPGDSRKLKKALDEGIRYVRSLKGFKGVHPVSIEHNILIFDTLNNAKIGKNLLGNKGISSGNYIVPILIEKQYL